MKNKIVLGISIFIIFLLLTIAALARPPERSKFYDFDDQLIDGEIRRPTALYIDHRQRARFERLLRLKRTFLPKLYQTAKEKVFK